MTILDKINDYLTEGKSSGKGAIVKYARQMAAQFSKSDDDKDRLKAIAALSILSIAGTSGLTSGNIQTLIALAIKVSK